MAPGQREAPQCYGPVGSMRPHSVTGAPQLHDPAMSLGSMHGMNTQSVTGVPGHEVPQGHTGMFLL